MARTAHTVKQKAEIVSRKSKRISERHMQGDESEGSDEPQSEDTADLELSEQACDSDSNRDPTREAERKNAAIPLLALGKSILPCSALQRTGPSLAGAKLSSGQSTSPPVALACQPVSNISIIATNEQNRQHPMPFQYQSSTNAAPHPGQDLPGHSSPLQPHHAGVPGVTVSHPSRDQLLNMTLDELKELAAKRALSRPFVAETIRNKQRYVYPDHPHKVPCPARMMGPTHTHQNAFFVIPPTTPHGSELRCSHRYCRQNRIKFFYCNYCKMPVTRMKFDIRHAHKDKRAGDDQEAASILASLVGEQEEEQVPSDDECLEPIVSND